MALDTLKETILNYFPNATIASGGKELLMRCPFCGDSKNIHSKGHFYISLGNNDEPIFYNCFKCHAKGLLTPQVLGDMGIFDTGLNVELNIHNRSSQEESLRNNIYKPRVYYLNNNYVTPSPLSEAKLRYINKRLGQNLGYSELLQSKIVLNLSDLIYANKLDITRDKRLMQELNDSFIGFISQDNTFINMRNLRQGKVSKYIDTKYVNYNVFGLKEEHIKYYTIPTSINLSNPSRIKLHIAEGPFDILSIKYNLNPNSNRDIFSSIGGSSYYDIIDYFITDMGLLNLEVHVYFDNDQNRDHITRNINRLLSIYGIPLYTHLNGFEGEKDYGVPIDKIIDTYIKIN